MAQIVISTNTVLAQDLATLDSLWVIEYLIRYGYSESERVRISGKEMEKWWIKSSQKLLSLEWIKEQLGRKEGKQFENALIYWEVVVKITELNWRVIDGSWRLIAYRKPTAEWVETTFKLDRSYPSIIEPFCIEHNALIYLITKK